MWNGFLMWRLLFLSASVSSMGQHLGKRETHAENKVTTPFVDIRTFCNLCHSWEEAASFSLCSAVVVQAWSRWWSFVGERMCVKAYLNPYQCECWLLSAGLWTKLLPCCQSPSLLLIYYCYQAFSGTVRHFRLCDRNPDWKRQRCI